MSLQQKEDNYLRAIEQIEKIEQLQQLAIKHYEEGMLQLQYQKFQSERSDQQLNSFSVQPAHYVVKNQFQICKNEEGFQLNSEVEGSDIDDEDEALEKERALAEQREYPKNDKFMKCLECYLQLASQLSRCQ